MIFEETHATWIHLHTSNRSGERRGRLKRGHQHAEVLFLRNVWWPLRGNFKDLHPEYEVLDWRGRSYFADFAWMPGYVKLFFEIKGYASHVRDMDRQKYCNELNRETFFHALDYHVISFAYDDVEQRPDLCITLLRMVLSKYQPSQKPVSRVKLAEKEIIRLAIEQSRPLRPKDVELHLEINHKTSVLMLKRMCAKGLLHPTFSRSKERIVGYALVQEAIAYF